MSVGDEGVDWLGGSEKIKHSLVFHFQIYLACGFMHATTAAAVLSKTTI